MTDPVIFLFLHCVLVFFADPLKVIIHGGTGCKAGLGPALHGQGIDIIAGALLLKEVPLFLFSPVELRRLFVYLRAVGIRSLGKLRLSPVDTQEGKGLPLYRFSGFLLIIYIIRQGSHPVCIGRCGTDCPEGSDLCHITVLRLP